MTMSKTHDRGPFVQESVKGGGRAQPAADLASGAWGSSGFIPILYVPFALLSVLMTTLRKDAYSVLDKLDHFPMATFIQLCFGVFALFGYDDNALHAMMVHSLPKRGDMPRWESLRRYLSNMLTHKGLALRPPQNAP